MKKLSLLSVAFLLLFLTLHPASSFAHRLVIEPKESGSIKVVYEDGSFSTRTVVIVYDRHGDEIERGTLDSDGYFFYDETLAHFFVADDSMGHRTEWTVGEEVVYKSDPHRWITAGVVSLILVSIAVFFSYRVRQRSQ
jgi:nickel transport protein